MKKNSVCTQCHIYKEGIFVCFFLSFFFLITEGSAGKTMWFLSIEYSSSTMVKMV